ncbi:MAG: hypothetical protein AB1349_08530 [Elusimicrobiota bacterium]
MKKTSSIEIPIRYLITAIKATIPAIQNIAVICRFHRCNQSRAKRGLSCNRWKTIGLLYLYNELRSNKERNAYITHLCKCVTCQTELNKLRDIKEIIAQNTVSELPSDTCIQNLVQSSYQALRQKPVFLEKLVLRLAPAILGLLLILSVIHFREIKKGEKIQSPTTYNQIELNITRINTRVKMLDMSENNSIYQELNSIQKQLSIINSEVERL